jgi:hypothetical protein
MRSLITRLAMVGTIGVALAGCGTTNGTSLPVGNPGNGGGSSVPVTPQSQPPGSVPSVLIDGGTLTAPPAGAGTYVTANALTLIAQDTANAADAGPDVVTAGSGPLPVNPVGSHALVAETVGTTAAFKFTGVVPSLVEPVTSTGNFLNVTYGAIVLFVGAGTVQELVSGASVPPSYAVELSGGSGSTAYDVRVACKATPDSLAPTGGFKRYVCPLPAYGSATNSAAIPNPVLSGATGAFTPQSPTFSFVVSFPAITTTGSSSEYIVNVPLDFVYAEQGTK